jgi:SAM-dependent methyltransferase/methyltransferase-like protein
VSDLASARSADDIVRAAYDSMPYPSSSPHYTHPDRLATIAFLNGIDPPPPERCRVLELGCADGGNLIPMALEMPESKFTGVDLSPVQIESGRALAAQLGIDNLELQTRSILDVDASLGVFDYVICHGVFSWVTSEVQEKILEVCSKMLAPDGVAYVSYNTLPGWHLRQMVRDMVRFHTRGVDDPTERMAKAYDIVRFLAETSSGDDDARSIFLRSAREDFEEYRERPSYLLHEYLEETNTPLYFRDFAARLSQHSLQYLGESDAYLTEVDNLPAGVAQKLREFSHDRIELEQYLDFVLNRTFRRTLLCHAGRPLDRSMQPERMRRLFASAQVTVVDGQHGTFRTAAGKTFSTSHELTNAALSAMAKLWPRAVSFDELHAESGGDGDVLCDILHSLFWSGVVELHVLPPRCTNAIAAKPRVSDLARRQAAPGILITNQRRRVIKLDDAVARVLIQHLDGTRDRASLVRLLDAEVAAGRLDISVDGRIPDPQRIPSVLQALVDHHLKKMIEYALLVE